MNSPYIVVPYQIKELKEDNDNYIVEGYASVYGNIDLGGDIVEQGAFREDLLKNGNERPILWQHNRTEPIGLGIFSENNEGLIVKMLLPKGDAFVKDRVMPQIKIGSIKGLSIGYSVEDVAYETIDKVQIRILKRCNLYENSIVTFPMNQQARITAAKQFLLENNITFNEEKKVIKKDYELVDIEIAWDKGKAIKQIKKQTNSDDKPSTNYKNGFMWYDEDDKENFGAYKLPYTYVVDGTMKAVPKAIFAIAAALSGARGGIDIPEADKEVIKTQINKYYKKMDRESPFKNGKAFIDIDTIKCFEKRDFDKIFDFENIILSNSAKDYIVNCIQSGIKNTETPDTNESDILKGELQKLNSELQKQLRRK